MLLITPEEVLAYAFSPREKIAPVSIRRAKIDVAQEHFIHPIVGDFMFGSMTDGKFRPFVNEYIKPALAHYVRYGVIPELSIRMGDDGAVVLQGEELRSDLSKTTADQSSVSREQSSGEEQTQSKTSEAEISADESTDVATTGSESRQNSSTKTVTGEESVNRDHTVTDDQTQTRTTESSATSDETTSLTIDGEETKQTSLAKTISDTGSSENGTTETESDETRRTTVAKNSSGDDTMTTTTAGESKQVTVTGTTSEDTAAENGSVAIESDENRKTTASKSSSSESSDRTETEKNTTATSSDTRSGSIEVNEQGGRSLSQYRPATDAQRNLIMRRALADANVLMAKAVRYLVRNAHLFPGFDPAQVRPSGIITGFSALSRDALWK